MCPPFHVWEGEEKLDCLRIIHDVAWDSLQMQKWCQIWTGGRQKLTPLANLTTQHYLKLQCKRAKSLV